MNRMKLFAAALILTSMALVPAKAPAFTFCTFEQCYYNLSCSQVVCPPGFIAIPRCTPAPTCQGYCTCVQTPV